VTFERLRLRNRLAVRGEQPAVLVDRATRVEDRLRRVAADGAAARQVGNHYAVKLGFDLAKGDEKTHVSVPPRKRDRRGPARAPQYRHTRVRRTPGKSVQNPFLTSFGGPCSACCSRKLPFLHG
jgi:hypothetical protein